MHGIEAYAYQSHLRDVHPNLKFLCVMLTLGVTVYCYHPMVSLMVCLVTYIFAMSILRVKSSDFIKLMQLPMVFIAMSVIAIVVEIGTPLSEGVLFQVLDFISVTRRGLWRGITVFFTAQGAASTMYLFALSTPIVDFCEGLEQLKIPKSIVTLMLMIYRLIFVLSDMGYKLRTAQTSRLGYQSFRTSLHSFGALVSGIFIRSIRKTYLIYDALESRGYNGHIRVLRREFHGHYPLLISVFIFNAILMVMWVYI